MNTPKGEGFAQFLLDYGPESDLYWVVFMTETGEMWTFANKLVRASKNFTLGRANPTHPLYEAPSSDDSDAQKLRPRAVVNEGLGSTQRR